MTIENFSADTLDDLLHEVYQALIERGTLVAASRGDTRELAAVALELTNPRARLSRSEARGRIFSCLGELCWYLAADDSVGMIQHYISAYAEEAIDGRVLGAYGPRLFGQEGQVQNVIELLRARPTTRRAVIQLFDAKDIRRAEGDVPCTCTLQFLARESGLDAVIYMRSNDAVKGLTHDVFCFTMLHEIVARTLGLEVGRYWHMAGSLHMYTYDLSKVKRFLDEGFQSTKSPMPPMPEGDPWPAIKALLGVEAQLRDGGQLPVVQLAQLPQYWQELGWVLAAMSPVIRDSPEMVTAVKAALERTVYSSLVAARLSKVAPAPSARPNEAGPAGDLLQSE